MRFQAAFGVWIAARPLHNQFGNRFELRMLRVFEQHKQQAFNIAHDAARRLDLLQAVGFIGSGARGGAFLRDKHVVALLAQIQHGLQHADMRFAAD